MKRYKLHVHIDALDDDQFLIVMSHLRTHHFSYSFARSFVPPNKMEFVFDGLSEEGLNYWKNWWRSLKLEGGSFTEIETFG